MSGVEFSHMVNAFPTLLKGTVLTIQIATFGLLFGFLIGAFTGLARTKKTGIIYTLASTFVEVIRGTPIIVQVLWIYFAIPMVSPIDFDKITAGIIAIAVNSGAYISEIVRGAVQSIDKGQMEAGRSLGLTKAQAMLYIIWPQALKRMIPPLGNQFIISLKDTSLLAIIGVVELTNAGTLYVSDTYRSFEIYTLVALMYLAMTLSLSLILKRIERRIES